MTIPATPTTLAAPDWTTIQHRVTCPLCEYELRGLTEPRCPECGYSFQWAEVVDPDRQPHPYLFEHHPRRPFWSFCRTLIGGMHPRAFWRELKPVQQSRPRMLLVYWFVTTLVGMTGVAAASRFSQINQAFVSGSGPTAGTSWLNGLAGITGWGIAWNDDFLYLEFNRIPAGLSERSTSPLFAAAIVVWPIASFTILLIFAASMRRAKIRRIHVARCLIYSSDAGVWLAGGVVLVMGIYTAFAAMFREPLFSPWPILLLLLVRWWLAVNWKMYCAYRYYLRFDHAFSTIASSQAILLLLALWLAL